MAFTRRTEIRHISPSDLSKIAQLLSQTFAWKKLMQAVPFELTDPEHLTEGKPKYNLNHIKLIENSKRNKPPAEIFLEEWATTGKIRPTLSHLLQLLIKSELFRAADYVAISLLNEAPPIRPTKGPAAKVDIALPLQEENSIEEQVSKMNYPRSSELMNLNADATISKVLYEKQLFDARMQSPISEVDLINFSASLGSNVHREEHQTTNAILIPTNHLSNDDSPITPPPIDNVNPTRPTQAIDLQLDVSPLTDNSHSLKFNSQPKGSNRYLQSTLPIFNDNQQHHTIQTSHNSFTDSISSCSIKSENTLPNVSLLNEPVNSYSPNSDQFIPEEHSDSSAYIPNLSGLNLSDSDYNRNEEEFSGHIPLLSTLFIDKDGPE